MQNLRSYQLAAASAVLEQYRQGVHSTLIEHATGTGKTTTAVAVIRQCVQNGGRVLALAHRRELIGQLADRLRGAGIITGIELADQRASVEPVVVASVQTMRGDRLRRWSPESYDLVVIDECHHSPSTSYQRILRYFASARVLGLTATGDRADGVALGGTFETVAHRYGIVEAIAAGHLVPVIATRVEVAGLDLSAVRSKSRRTSAENDNAEFTDLHAGDLGRAAIAPEAVEGIAGPLLTLAGARRTIVFAVDRRHARAIADALCARRPGCAEVVDGQLNDEDRADVLARHRAGKFQFLVNVLVLVEGFDDPEIACVAMARPTQSRALYTQACGRGLRLSSGKYDCLVLDFTPERCPHVLVGPQDVLAGALAAPAARGRAASSSHPAAPAVAYVSTGKEARFATRALDLLKRGARGAARGAGASGRGLWKVLVSAVAG